MLTDFLQILKFSPDASTYILRFFLGSYIDNLKVIDVSQESLICVRSKYKFGEASVNFGSIRHLEN